MGGYRLRALAFIAALAVGAFIMLPDFYTLPILGGTAILAGLVIAGSSWWGWLVVLAGIGLIGVGIRNYVQSQKEEDAEGDKAREEVSRRFKGIREDKDVK